MLNETENQFSIDGGCENAIWLIVEYQGNKFYKSMLVSQVNANPFLFKDKLTHVRKSMYFNILIVTSFNSTCLLNLGNNCGVYFVQDNNNEASSKQQSGKIQELENPFIFVMAQVMEHGGQGECKKLGGESEIDGAFQDSPLML